MGEAGYALPLRVDVEALPASSKYGEVTSARDSEAVVATDVKGVCRLCGRGTCWPVRYGESKEESVYLSTGGLFLNLEVHVRRS